MTQQNAQTQPSHSRGSLVAAHELLTIKDGHAVTTSLRLAKVFHKNHFDVLICEKNNICR